MSSRFLGSLRTGVTVRAGKLALDVRVSRTRRMPLLGVTPQALARHVRRLFTLFPELHELSGWATPEDAADPGALLEFCNDYVSLIHDEARETQLRNLLVRLHDPVSDPEQRRALEIEIAKSNLRSGVPERALALLELESADPDAEALKKRLNEDIDAAERFYGAAAGMIRSLKHWRALPGDARGRCLVSVFEGRMDDLRGKAILHVGPEPELKQWLLARREELGLRYRTLDAFSDEEDIAGDVTALDLEDGSFDLVLCHRVLEHILDDESALRELFRVLRPGGVLNVSVPMSMQRERTVEWIVPDRSHNGHVRQYGRDFEDRLARAGFGVEVERMLLERSLDAHLERQTFPMRIYVCTKPPRPAIT